MTEILRRFICHNNRCGKTFSEDGNQLIGSIRCPHCGSPNIDHNEFSRSGGSSSPDPASEILTTPCPKKFIVKVYTSIKNFYPLYFIGADDNSETKPIGTITRKGLASMEKEELLTEVPVTEIIENYFRHKWFLSDVKSSKYYELKIKE